VASVAARLGDSIETVQSVYLHESDRDEREAKQRESLAALGRILAAQDGSTGQQNPLATGINGR
jgi:hypothetical protein